MRLINAFCLICIFHCATLSIKGLYASEPMMRYADSLYAAGYYFEASIEYERVIFESQSVHTRVLANLSKADALKQLGHFSRARRDLQRSLMFRGDDSLRLEIQYQFAFCSYMSGMVSEANSMLLQIRNSFGQIAQNRIFLLESLVMVDMQRWDELREHILMWLEAYSIDSHKIAALLYEYDILLEEGSRGLEKDPGRAELWSTFVPGAGQLYAGEPGWAVLNVFSQLAGLTSFGLLAYNGFYIAGVVAGLGIFQSFYFGGIKQASELTSDNVKSRLEQLQTAMRYFLLDVAAMPAG